MININKGRVEVSGNFTTILAEFTNAVCVINGKCNKIPDMEEDLFLKMLLEGLMKVMFGGDESART